MLSVCSESQKGPSASVSLVIVRLTVFCFFFFISVLGEVVAMVEEGPAVAALGAELPPLEALMNFPP